MCEREAAVECVRKSVCVCVCVCVSKRDVHTSECMGSYLSKLSCDAQLLGRCERDFAPSKSLEHIAEVSVQAVLEDDKPRSLLHCNSNEFDDVWMGPDVDHGLCLQGCNKTTTTTTTARESNSLTTKVGIWQTHACIT